MDNEDHTDNGGDERHLEDSDPEMPPYRDELAEVYLAESDIQDKEHKQRQCLIEERSKESPGTIQRRNQGKDKVRQRSRAYRHRQCPILYKLNDLTHLAS